MYRRISTMLVLFAIRAAADPRLFHEIRNKDALALVSPNGECDAKVVGRQLDRLTVRLKKTTPACGLRNSLVSQSRTDVEDVVDAKRAIVHGRGGSTVVTCAKLGLVVGAAAGLAIGGA